VVVGVPDDGFDGIPVDVHVPHFLHHFVTLETYRLTVYRMLVHQSLSQALTRGGVVHMSGHQDLVRAAGDREPEEQHNRFHDEAFHLRAVESYIG
jgi:hypothetical protein